MPESWQLSQTAKQRQAEGDAPLSPAAGFLPRSSSSHSLPPSLSPAAEDAAVGVFFFFTAPLLLLLFASIGALKAAEINGDVMATVTVIRCPARLKEWAAVQINYPEEKVNRTPRTLSFSDLFALHSPLNENLRAAATVFLQSVVAGISHPQTQRERDSPVTAVIYFPLYESILLTSIHPGGGAEVMDVRETGLCAMQDPQSEAGLRHGCSAQLAPQKPRLWHLKEEINSLTQHRATYLTP